MHERQERRRCTELLALPEQWKHQCRWAIRICRITHSHPAGQCHTVSPSLAKYIRDGFARQGQQFRVMSCKKYIESSPEKGGNNHSPSCLHLHNNIPQNSTKKPTRPAQRIQPHGSKSSIQWSASEICTRKILRGTYLESSSEYCGVGPDLDAKSTY